MSYVWSEPVKISIEEAPEEWRGITVEDVAKIAGLASSILLLLYLAKKKK